MHRSGTHKQCSTHPFNTCTPTSLSSTIDISKKRTKQCFIPTIPRSDFFDNRYILIHHFNLNPCSNRWIHLQHFHDVRSHLSGSSRKESENGKCKNFKFRRIVRAGFWQLLFSYLKIGWWTNMQNELVKLWIFVRIRNDQQCSHGSHGRSLF